MEVDLRTSDITKDKDGYFIMTKELIHQEYLTILNVYAANNRVSGHMKQQLTELNVK